MHKVLEWIWNCGGTRVFHAYKTAQRHGGKMTWMICNYEHRGQLGWNEEYIEERKLESETGLQAAVTILELH